jgi:hypothetical protein
MNGRVNGLVTGKCVRRLSECLSDGTRRERVSDEIAELVLERPSVAFV